MTVLAVRLDSAGDVLLTGPALRAIASVAEVTVLCGPNGEAAARLLPAVTAVQVWRCPWIDPHPCSFDGADVAALVEQLAAERHEAAVVFTSFHQSALPTALVLRLAGVRRIAAISDDYPGALLDVRHHVDDDMHEVHRALSLATAAGFALPPDDCARLAVRRPLPDVDGLVGDDPYVVVHPGASAPARAWSPDRSAGAVRALVTAGHRVVVTGAASEAVLTRRVAGTHGVDLGARLTFAELAAVLDRADVVVVGNTGPAHLAAAVGTPVVSLFAPTVPSARWCPFGVPVRLLGDQEAPCKDTRARVCPVPGHPCLDDVMPGQVVRAVESLVGVSA
jgi:ADP-heptose:LPS heptosyltransferase